MPLMVANTLLIPAFRRLPPGGEYHPFDEDAKVMTATFRLMRGFLSTEGFYECTHCRGCGSTCFDLGPGVIPEEIIEEIGRHANLCEGLFASKRSSF